MAAGASFLWCMLAALSGTIAHPSFARSVLAAEALVRPVPNMPDFSTHNTAAFSFGAMRATALAPHFGGASAARRTRPRQPCRQPTPQPARFATHCSPTSQRTQATSRSGQIASSQRSSSTSPPRSLTTCRHSPPQCSRACRSRACRNRSARPSCRGPRRNARAPRSAPNRRPTSSSHPPRSSSTPGCATPSRTWLASETTARRR
eukprot:3866083-Pleurochrysis_carterae.AAC.1